MVQTQGDTMTLTVKAVEAAKPKDKPYKLADGAGLYLFVSPAGGKSWRANYTKAGKQATRTYGRYPEMSLADARKAHLGAKEVQPVKVVTFEAVARDWLELKLPTLSNGKHQIQVVNSLERFVFPRIGNASITALTRSELVSVVQAVQATGVNETAHRVAGRIGMVFDYALDAGILENHPASNLVRVLQARKTKAPMASIPPDEAGALLRAIRGYEEPVTRLGLQFLAHVFVRPTELRLMEWGELKEGGTVWVIPEERMKMGKPHVVPLSDAAQKILEGLELINGDKQFVLASPLKPKAPISENTLLFALYRLGYRGRMTAHGFRALASTVLNEHSGFAHDVIERQLSHKETDEVRAAYNRASYLPKRRELMTWWAHWLQTQADQQPASE
jgi:integrase